MRFLKVLLLLAISVGFPSRCQSTSPGCDLGWLLFGDNCFFLNHDAAGKATWTVAFQACQALGGRLADIRDEEEWDFVKVQLRSPNQYMIGITEDSDGQWKFLDGSDAFVKWAPNQPDHDIEKCGSLLSTESGYYNNILCDKNEDSELQVDFGTFICKKAA